MGFILIDLISLLLLFGPQTLLYLLNKLCYFHNSISSSYIITFVSHFDKLQIYPYILYKFQVSQFSRFEFKLRKIQIMSTKYPKHVENDYGIFWGVTSGV